MANVAQRSFAGGELAPALYARTDQQKYATGLRTCRNMFARPHGGVSNRPGTALVAAVKDSTVATRLLPFVFNADQTYVLAFGDRTLRLMQNGAQVAVAISSVTAWLTLTAYALGDLRSRGGTVYYCYAAHTSGATTQPGVGASWQTNWWPLTTSGTNAIYEIPTPYGAGELAAIQLVQSADVVTLTHPAYAPQELRRLGNTTWTLTPIAFGPTIGAPAGLAFVSGGVAGVDTYYAVTAVAAGTREEGLPSILKVVALVPTTGAPIVISWQPVMGAIEYNIYRSSDGATYGYIFTVGGVAIAASDTSWTTVSNSTSQAPPGGAFIPSTGQARNPVLVAAPTDRASDGKYDVHGTLELLTTDGALLSRARVSIYYSRDGEARVLARSSAPIQVGTGGISRPVDETIDVPDNGYAALTIDVVPEVDPASDTTLATVTFTGTSITWLKSPTQVSDALITPNYISAPPTQQNLFGSAATYPSVVANYQQRRMFANTATLPEHIWGSRTGLPRNFSESSPIEDSDLVAWALAGRQVNAVRHLLDLGTLVVFTAGGVYVTEGDQSGILKPNGINPRRVSAHGASTLRPIELSDSALYVQARGVKVRDLRPDAVATQGYQGNDLTVFASHLFQRYTLADWDYAEEPHGLVLAIRSDGVMLGLTYLREHGIWGWHRHDTDGAFESVCVVPEGTEDRVYVVVRRTINGVTKRYIERFASRYISAIETAVFADCALTYDGRNTTATTMSFADIAIPVDAATVTCTASAAAFAAGDVGNEVRLERSGAARRFLILHYINAQTVTGYFDDSSAADALGFTVGTVWAKAVRTFSGLDHLEGKRVSVLGDGYVEASPNNSEYPVLTVTGGSITIPNPRAIVTVGLPYLSDVETLDIDSAGGASLKDKKILVQTVNLMVEESRGIVAGGAAPTDDATDPLEGLVALKPSPSYTAPTALLTDGVSIIIPNRWNDTGRIFVRQVDPLPLTILSATPQGIFPPAA